MPTLALTNNIAFTAWRTSIKPSRWSAFGTIGWIIAGICIGVTGTDDTTGIFTGGALFGGAGSTA
jgi:hypothetical protein